MNIDSYVNFSLTDRDRYIFRGQADSRWPLMATLDRLFQNPPLDDNKRVQQLKRFLLEFKRSSFGLNDTPYNLQAIEPHELELLARHHAVPTTVLDWTSSPYIAAFFAFSQEYKKTKDRDVAVWIFDRKIMFPHDENDEDKRLHIEENIRILDDIADFGWNPRAIDQRAVFMKIESINPSLEALLGDSIWKIVIPYSERKVALSDLDEMGINARNLFRDLDGAARTAIWRVLNDRGEV